MVTKLENLFVFGKKLWKISSNWWFKKKGVTNLTSAQTFKVCSMAEYNGKAQQWFLQGVGCDASVWCWIIGDKIVAACAVEWSRYQMQADIGYWNIHVCKAEVKQRSTRTALHTVHSSYSSFSHSQNNNLPQWGHWGWVWREQSRGGRSPTPWDKTKDAQSYKTSSVCWSFSYRGK